MGGWLDGAGWVGEWWGAGLAGGGSVIRREPLHIPAPVVWAGSCVLCPRWWCVCASSRICQAKLSVGDGVNSLPVIMRGERESLPRVQVVLTALVC